MTKAEWIRQVRDAMEKPLSGADVERVLDAQARIMAAELIGGGEVAFAGVGKLKIKKTLARKGRNPQTGAAITIPAGQKVIFSPAKDLKEALKG